MRLLTKEQQESYENAKIFEKKNGNEYVKDKIYRKVRDHCHYTGEYRGGADSKYNLKYSVPKNIPTAFDNGYSYGYHFIIKKLAEEFET